MHMYITAAILVKQPNKLKC